MSTSTAFKTVRKQSLSDSVYRQIKDKIVNSELACGAELPAERTLSEMLGVNRGAVREAIKRLQQAGLVAVRQGGNHVVLDYKTEGGLELLSSLLVDAQGSINPGVARSILSLRSVLAPDIAAAAAQKGGARLADNLNAVLRRMRSSAASLDELQELALEFWSLLVNAGGNIAFRLAFNSMNKTYRSVWPLLTQVMEAEFRDTDNLQALSDAVRRRDAEAARACAQKHLALGSRAMDLMLKQLQKDSRKD
ncbi:MAG: FadR/GntR family transcriptional regulator [Stenotrophobium sp.]